MNITPEKRADARRRATCVRELRRWRKRKRNRPPIAQVIAELSQRYPNLPICRSSLYAWAKRVTTGKRPDALIDRRGGDQRGCAKRRAMCADRFKVWRSMKADRNTLDDLLIELRSRYPGIEVSRSSLYVWSKHVTTDKRPADLVDRRSIGYQTD